MRSTVPTTPAAAVSDVHKQHVVSATVLRRFATDGPGSAGLQILPIELEYLWERRPKPKGVGGCGWIKDFVPFDSGSMENVWGATERHLPSAFRAVEDSSIFQDPQLTAVLRDTVALHYIRSERTRTLHKNTVKAWSARGPQRHSADLLRRAAAKGIDLSLSGPDDLTDIVEQQIAQIRAEFSSGELLRNDMEDLYADARGLLSTWQLEILTAGEGEFVIGDTPAITMRTDADGNITSDGIVIGQCHTTVLPIGPKHCLALGPANSMRGELSSAVVDLLNRAQVKSAHRWIYSRPRDVQTLRDLVQRGLELPLTMHPSRG